MTNTTTPEGYERINWPEVRKGDVLMHANGDRLTVSAVDHVGYPTCKSTAGSWHSVSTLRGAGFSPYRKVEPLPTTPGAYLDKDGDYWLIDKDGSWYDWSTLWQPELYPKVEPHTYAPFTRLVPMPTEEQVAYAICNAMRHTGDRECEYDHEATAAVMALLAGEGGE